MKLLWTGTDSLMLVDLSKRKLRKRPYWWIFRLLIRLIEPFIQEHYVKSDMIRRNLERFGVGKPVKVWDEPLRGFGKVDRIEHEGFNVLYYYPKSVMEDGFVRWLYGVDFIDQLIRDFPMVNFLRVDGGQDMADYYPITDIYLRPNRHDGYSRMIKECKELGIPYYWSKSGEPQYRGMVLMIKQLIK